MAESATTISPSQPKFTLWPWSVAGVLFVPMKMAIHAKAYADIRDKPISQWGASNWMAAQALTDFLATCGFMALFIAVTAFFLWRNRQADLKAIVVKPLIGFVLLLVLINITLKFPGLVPGL